ncbi:MAG: vanadium-dependent haloperoxidase [Chitinophagaceae bacterium]
MRIFFYLAILVAVVSSCKQKDYTQYTADPILFCKTVKKLNDVVLYNNFPPMIASRNYVYASIAAYECIAAGDSNYVSLSGQIKHLPQMPQVPAEQIIDHRLAALLSFVKVGNAVTFPEGVLMEYYDELKKEARKAGMPSSILKNTVSYSDHVSDAIIEWSKKDNYAQTRSSEKFTVTMEEGRWVPTPPAYSQGLEPSWCEVRPILLDSADQFSPPPAPRFNIKDTNSVYYKELMEVKTMVENLTEEQKHIADFFDDNPFNLHVTGHVMYATKKFSPPGHWMNIVGIAAEKAGSNFETTVAAYAATAIALYDGFISCWKSKYKENSVRPETVINKYFDQEWRPYIQTPPFPSYVSGHSVISAASAEVMSSFFGDNFSYTDTSELEFGIPNRSFTSFREAALEANWSRLYGGIHFRADLEEGNKVGTKLGEYIAGRLIFDKRNDKLAINQNQQQ